MVFPRKDSRETKVKMTDVSYVSLRPFGRYSDAAKQRTWINSICLNILVPFTFCVLYRWWTWDCLFYNCVIFFPAWGKQFKYTNNSHNPFWDSHIFFDVGTHTFLQKKKRHQNVVREAFLLVCWSPQLWNSLQNNHLKFLWQRFDFLMPKYFLNLVVT